MFNLFKTKEEKDKILQGKLEQFILENKDYFNSYCFNGKDIVIYKEPEIIGNRLVLNVITENTPKGYTNFKDISFLELQYDDNFMKRHRNMFIKIRSQMENLGLHITKSEL